MTSATCLKCGLTRLEAAARRRAGWVNGTGCGGGQAWAYHQWTIVPARSEETIVIQRLTVIILPEDTKVKCGLELNSEDWYGSCTRNATASVRYETWQNGKLSANTRHFCFAHIPRRPANALRRDRKMPKATKENGGVMDFSREPFPAGF